MQPGDNHLEHIGVKRRSGRYPWGSGDDPYQSGDDFLKMVGDLKKEGLNDMEICKALNIKNRQGEYSTKILRSRRTIAIAERRAADIAMAERLAAKGYSPTEIGRRMDRNESSVRSLLDPGLKLRNEMIFGTADVLEQAVADKKYIDIGPGVEANMGVARTKLDAATTMLLDSGEYEIHYIKAPLLGTGEKTTFRVLTKKDVPYSEVSKNRDQIETVNQYTDDGGLNFDEVRPPKSISSDRVYVRYGDEGGADKDGVLELRPGVAELSLGGAKYGQVRVAVDDTHFMKGMAIYNKDIPDGYDIVYNVNKNRDPSDPYSAFKPLKDSEESPFKTTVRQQFYIDENGERQQSPLNIVGYREGDGVEGSWGAWSRTLSSQVLSKQPVALATKQLELSAKIRQEEFDEIMSLTNPAVKRELLTSFADSADAAAAHLKAAALPRQRSQVLLPINSMKDNEVYAPNFRDGELVVLVRHPHGGRFEIPEVVVNNRNPEAKAIMGNAQDAIGINSRVAARLSGADFDGDTVLVIPNGGRAVKTAPVLKGLSNFDPKTAYPEYPGMKRMDNKTKQMEMGKVSNLITDMTIKNASPEEIARAVRHSMVVIDAEKHGLNYVQSFKDNGIAALKERYQGGKNAGASTIVSKAGSTKYIDEREPGRYIVDPNTGKTRKITVDPVTGKKLYTDTGRVYIDKKGKEVKAQTKTAYMDLVDDAHELSSGSRMEKVYADYANKMKSLANQARKQAESIEDIPWNDSARKTYSPQVKSLRAKLLQAIQNKPNERKAQVVANAIYKAKRDSNPDLDPDQLRKLKYIELDKARTRFGAKKNLIDITPREWEAIQAGALSSRALRNVLKNASPEQIKSYSMPRTSRGLSSARTARAKAMLDSGHTPAEVADALGVSVSTLYEALD